MAATEREIDKQMKTLSITEAASAIGKDRSTVHRYCQRGLLPAQRRGIRGEYRIEVEEIRRFAEQYNLPFNLPDNVGTEE